MSDPSSIKVIAFKLAGPLAAAWAVYWLWGTRADMANWLDQGDYSNVAFTVLVGLAPIAGWLHAAFRPKA